MIVILIPLCQDSCRLSFSLYKTCIQNLDRHLCKTCAKLGQALNAKLGQALKIKM